MSLLELLLIAISLSMDAFAVAICRGLCMQKITFKKSLIVGLYFGIFQAGMPLIGYYLAKSFSGMIKTYDHWIAFILLTIIGVNMIRESFKKDDEPEFCDRDEVALRFSNMFVLAVATSIDALAVGVTFAFLQLKVGIFAGVGIIGVTTLLVSMIGVKIGNLFGAKLKSRAEIFGGVILILIGLKILLEHLGVINF